MESDPEVKILEFWEKNKIQQKAYKMRANGPKFYMCDGPPFATGGIHVGTAWNKSLKDAVCKYKMLQGHSVHIRAGYDTHGLPIETQVEKDLGVKEKKDIENKIGIEKFTKRCRELCEKYIKLMSTQFIRLGTWMDYDDPYITYTNDFIERSWATFKKAHEKGLLYNDVYVNPHCPRCQTTLANYELEYHDMVDPAIFVKFKVADKEKLYLVVWTTTPWTLVSNVAVMAHPIMRYVKAKVGEEEWIFAKERLGAVQDAAGESLVIVEEFAGKDLAKHKYQHPLMEEVNRTAPQTVVMSDEFVTAEDGSGLVHCAPGHGPEDYIIGKRYELEIFNPVAPNGRYTEAAGQFAGENVLEVNDKIIKTLKDKGLLIKADRITHSYPACWRCKTKLIHLSSNQWFIRITKIKDRMSSEVAKTVWIPDFANKWMSNFVDSAKDWCISRQRYWGIPLPIWKCEKCGELKVIGSVEELGKKLPDLHRPHIDELTYDCPKCHGIMKRVPDVLDVWFDSGNAVWAGLRPGEEKLYPTDMIIEGKDQIRGWFYSLLGSGVVLNDEIPYSSLLMHGYVVDEKGMAMHKSLGNFVPWEDVIAKYPADAIRLMALSNVTWDDLRFNWNEMNEAKSELVTVINIGTYLERFYVPAAKQAESVEDEWLSSRLNSLIKNATADMDKGETYAALRKVRKFIVGDVSRFYMKLIKKRTDINVLHESVLKALVLASPFIPFTTEGLYRKVYAKGKDMPESVYLHSWPKADEGEIDLLLEKQMSMAQEIVDASNSVRAEKAVKLRWPLEEIIVATKMTEVKDAVHRTDNVIRMLANVRKVVTDSTIQIDLSEKAASKLGEDVVAKIDAVRKKNEADFFKGVIVIDGKEHDYREFITVDRKGYSCKAMPWGVLLLKTEISEELKMEGLLSEVRRRIQSMRKEAGLVEKDQITVHISGSRIIKDIVAKHGDAIKGEVNAKEILTEAGGKHKKTWDVDDEKVTVGITPLK
ncbi:Isoleucine--tRNA ligase [uncultured archaeon]|nr:Isoleucine--tRNA ligase [uncultured archaeon]